MVCPIRDEPKNAEFLMASLKDALTIIKDGHPRGWERMLELTANKECTDFGYNSQNLEMPASIATKGLMLPLSKYLSSVGYLDDNRICTMEEDKEEGVVMIFTKD